MTLKEIESKLKANRAKYVAEIELCWEQINSTYDDYEKVDKLHSIRKKLVSKVLRIDAHLLNLDIFKLDKIQIK